MGDVRDAGDGDIGRLQEWQVEEVVASGETVPAVEDVTGEPIGRGQAKTPAEPRVLVSGGLERGRYGTGAGASAPLRSSHRSLRTI